MQSPETGEIQGIKGVSHAAFLHRDGTKVMVLSNTAAADRLVQVRVGGVAAQVSLPPYSIITEGRVRRSRGHITRDGGSTWQRKEAPTAKTTQVSIDSGLVLEAKSAEEVAVHAIEEHPSPAVGERRVHISPDGQPRNCGSLHAWHAGTAERW